MRYGRAKAARKTLRFFRINAHIKPPYKVLIDGNFLVTAVKQKVPIRERISRVLQNETFDLFTCRSNLDELMLKTGELYQKARQLGLDECQIIETKSIPPLKSSTTMEVKTIEQSKHTPADPSKKRKRGDDDNKSGSETQSRDHIRRIISEVEGSVSNRRGFLVATQDENLSDELRSIPNIPLLRLSRGVLLLEAPSAASRQRSVYEEKGKQLSGGGTTTTEEKEILRRLKDRERKKKDDDEVTRTRFHPEQRKRHKAKGPNPLSCRKKKKDSHGSSSLASNK